MSNVTPEQGSAMPNVHAARRAAWLARLRCGGDKEAKIEAAMEAWDEVMEEGAQKQR